MKSVGLKCRTAPTGLTKPPPRTAICTVTAVGDLQDIPVIGLVREIEAAIGTEVRSYQLTIHYLCPACRQKEAH